jgi:release factor glutamine methyltransferase
LRIRDIMSKAGATKRTDILPILSFALSMKKEKVLINLDKEIGEDDARFVEAIMGEREKGKPLAYITGEKEFFSRSFFVDGRVLIPRPETELLVEEALAILERREDIRSVMDVGTGSGVIGNTIARLSLRRVLCVDISRDALAVAQKNSLAPEVSERLTFLCSDLMTGIKRGRKFDMIVANLPYVAGDEWDDVMRGVKDYEPELALLGGPDGLDIYRRFVRLLPDHLSEHGCVLVEIGDGQGKEMVNMFESRGLRAVLKKDLAQKERVVIGSWTNL